MARLLSSPSLATSLALFPVCSVLFLVFTCMSVVSPALPEIQSSFNASAALTAGVMSAFAVGRLAVSFPSGLLAERLGEQVMMALGAAVFTCGALACALAPTMPVLLAGRLAQGMGSAFLAAACLSYIVSALPASQTGQAMGFYQGAISVGSAAGPALGGLMIAAMGFRSVFWASVALALLAVPIALLWLRPVARHGPSREARGGMSPWRALAHAAFLFAVLGNFQVFFIRTGAQSTLLPLWLDAEAHFSAAGIGVLLSVGVIIQIILVFPAGAITDRWGARRVTVWNLAACALCIAIIPFFPSTLGTWVTNMLLNVAFAIIGPALAAYVFVATPLRRGETVAFYRLSADIGQVLSPMVAGFALDLAGYTSAFLLLAATNVGLWLWSLVLTESPARPATATAAE